MTVTLVKSILEQRANVWEQGKGILDTAEAEGRALTVEEQTAFDAINADLDRLDSQRKSIEDAQTRAYDAELAMRGLGAMNDPNTDADAAIRSFLRGEGERHFETKAGGLNFRDLTKGTATAGGNTVPTSFRDQLLEHMIDNSGVLSAEPTVLTTTSGETIEIPVTTSHGTAALVAEGAQIQESDPAFAKRSLGAYKYGKVIQLSRELVDDTAVDLLGYIARQGGAAVGNAFGVDLVVGNASSKPSGIVQTASTGVTGSAAVSGVFTTDNLIDLQYSVIGPYRRNAKWMMRDATVAYLRKLKDTDGQYLWQPSLQVGTPDVFLGKPVITDPNVAAVAAGAKSVIFGDFSAYFVRMAGGVRFERSDDFAFDTDLVSFKVVIRGDGILADQTGAVKVFVGGA